VYAARSRIDGVEGASVRITVVGADLHGPVACQVNYERWKEVELFPAGCVTTSFDSTGAGALTVEVTMGERPFPWKAAFPR
jgi:hypothetical protein